MAAAWGASTARRASAGSEYLRRRLTTARGNASRSSLPLVIALGAGIVGIIVVQLLGPLHADSASIRAAIETALTISLVISARFITIRFEHTRRLQDLALLAALITLALIDFVSTGLPAVIGLHKELPGTPALVLTHVLVALAFLAAARAPGEAVVHRVSRRGMVAGITLIVIADLSVLMSSQADAPAISGHAGIAAIAAHPVAGTLELACVAVMLMAALLFIRREARLTIEVKLLAAAVVLLACARLSYAGSMVSASSWITPALLFRALAAGTLLAMAVAQYRLSRRESAATAVIAERDRILRDLHDGLAQDLAFIAAHAQRLASELGEEHPVAIAARRALNHSRVAMVDLAASNAPTTAAALTRVAHELARPFGTAIEVRVPDNVPDYSGAEREEIVRIAREAIVNALKHGRADRVVVELGCKDSRWLLRVRDDGCGMPADGAESAAIPGFGQQAMRARAAAIGGRLTTQRLPEGGTQLEVVTL